MKLIKHVFVMILIVLVTLAITRYFASSYLMFTCLLIIIFFTFNMLVRKSLSYKNYFTSKYNLLTTKVWSEKVFDIPKELMFEKMVEVINDSHFTLVDSDENKFELLAISAITFTSWGENIYISFESKGNETILKFCSATLFQVYDWGKNEKNFTDLLQEIDSSLTV